MVPHLLAQKAALSVHNFPFWEALLVPDKLTIFYSGCDLQEVIPREYVLDCYDDVVAEA